MAAIRGLLAALLAVSSSIAWADSDFGACTDDSRPVPERIAACTRAIDSGTLATADLGGAFYSRGNARLAQGDHDRAIYDYNAAAQLMPRDVFVLNNRAGAWSAKGEYDRAIADYSEAFRLDPRFVDAIYNRGNQWRLKGDYDRAISDYNEALRLDPRYKFALHNRGIAWFNKGEVDRAIADYTRAIRYGLNDDQVFLQRGLARFLRHDFEAAEKDLARGLGQRRDVYARTWLHISRARRGIDDVERLRRDLGTASNEWPEPIPLLFAGTLGPADLMKFSDDADPTKKLGNQCEARFYIAEWHLVRNEPRAAADLLREVVKSCPRSFVEYGLGVAELKQLENPRPVQPFAAPKTYAGAQDFPMGSSPDDVAEAFPPFRCATVAAGGSRSFCKYFQQPASYAQFNARNLATLWEFPVQATSFTFDDDKLEEISWTFEARGKPGGNVIDPAKLRGALESRFGPPASTRVIPMGRDGAIKRLDTTWVVNGERWVYRRDPEGVSNVVLYRFAKDAPGP